jgi:hypothetical protein
LTDTVGWSVQLWSGVVILTVLAGIALGLLSQTRPVATTPTVSGLTDG